MAHARLLSTLTKIAASSLLIGIFCLPVLGQGSTPNRGFQPGGSFALSDIETINTTNGNLSLHLPLGSLPAGRGGFSGQLNLHYDSKLYDSKTQWYQDTEHLEFGNPHVAIRNMLVTSNEGGWHYGTGYELQLIDRMSQYPLEIAPQYPALETIYHYKVKVAFPDGSLHEFIPRVGSQFDQGYSDIRPDGYQSRFNGSSVQDVPYLTNSVIYYTFDGSYVKLEVQHDSDSNWWNNPWILTFPDGTRVTNFGSRITDRNGNYVEISEITYNGHPSTQLIDQLGRKIIIEHGGVSGGDVIHVPGVGGVDLTYQIYWKAIQIFKTYSTVVNDHFSPDGYPDILGSQFVVSRIDLPAATGGLQYTFGYNAADSGSSPCCTPSYGWGELSSVTLPSGAQAQYEYQLDDENGPGFDYTWDRVLRNSVKNKTLTYQQQYDGNSTPVTEIWNYTIENGLTTIENPDHGIISQLNDTQRTYRTQQPDGTVIENIYQANRPQGFPSTSAYDEYSGIDAYDPQRVNSFVKTEFTSIRAGETLVKTAIKDYNYDKNGNVTTIREYDWVDYGTVPRTNGLPTGIPAGAVLKRVTTNTMALATPDASDSSSNNANSYWNSTAPNLRNAVASSEVSNGSATLSRSEFTYDNAATTGNLTQQKSWASTKGAYSNPLTGGNSISVSTQYDGYGNPTLSTDAGGHQTQLVYGSVGGFTDLYPTQIKTAYQTSVQRTETREYDFSTGAVTRTTDVDNNVSTATTYDDFGRPVLVKAAEGKAEETRTSTTYSDVNRRVIVKSDLNTAGDGKLVSIQHYDQLGRVRLARQLEDAATQSATDETTGIKVQTRYLYSGNFSYVLTSNPYRAATSTGAGSETSMGWSRSKADNGGRVLEMQTFGGASAPAPWGANTSSTGTVSTAYNANSTTVTDQAGKARKSVMDALGRLTDVYEDPAGLNYQTSYLYDALDNLARVTQGSQQRFFMYDSLKRLIRADNPEQETLNALTLNDPVTSHSNWSVKYEYDDTGNLRFKTDARSVVTENRYDELNRVTTVLYRINGQPDPNTGDIQYVYDNATYGKGRLWLTYRWGAKPSHTSVGAYDALGRVKQLWNLFGDGQGGWSAGYGISRNYNLAGQVTSQTYPSGRTANYAYDAAGRTSSVTGNLGDGVTRSYASSFVYNARSQMTQELFGTQIPLYHKVQYNVRGQLWDVRVSTNNDVNGSMNRGGLQFFYDSSLGYGTSGPDNNGNVVFTNIYSPEDENLNHWAITRQRYTYDSLNRLKSVTEYFVNYAQAESQQSVQTYDYDRWGNRTINAAQTSGAGINNMGFEVESARNRLYSAGDLLISDSQRRIRYDQAGNQTKDTYTGYGTATYDGDNHIVAIPDKFGSSSTYTYNANGQRVRRNINNEETWQIYGIDGELVAEYAANGALGTPQKEYGYRDRQLLITAASAGLKGQWKFDENSGTTAADSSGNNNPGTLSLGATWTTGQSGAATNLDDVNDYVQVGAQPSLVMTNTCTLSAWIYPTGAGSHATFGGIIVNKEGEYELARFTDGTIQWAFANTNPGWNWVNTGYVAPLNQWTHVAVTYDSGVVKTYINGTLIHTYSGSGVIGDIDNSQNDFRVGGRQVTSQNFQGRIDEVRVYNRALSASEVTTLPSGSAASSTQINWLVPDHLGTPRIILDQTGAFANLKRHDYLPFGEELPAGAGGRTSAMGYAASDGVRQQFTQKERDAETGLDYFGARYFSSTHGRFISTDPIAVTSENFVSPQRWNLYAYVNNNPLASTDRTGGDGQGKGGDKVITVFLHISADQSRDKLVDNATGKVVGNAPSPWPQVQKEAAKNGYQVVLFGSPEMTGTTGLPDPNTFAKSYNFESSLTNSEVAIYVGHGNGNGGGTNADPFKQEGLYIDSSYYKADGNHLIIEGAQSPYVMPKPDASARVTLNFSCDASRQGASYFNFTGTNQVMITINSGRNGVTNASTIEKAAAAFVKTYAATGGDYQKGAAAASKVIADSVKAAPQNRGDGVEVKKVN